MSKSTKGGGRLERFGALLLACSLGGSAQAQSDPLTRAQQRALTMQAEAQAMMDELAAAEAQADAQFAAWRAARGMTANVVYDPPPVPGGDDGQSQDGGSSFTNNAPPAFTPPGASAPCDTYKLFWFSRISLGSGQVQLVLSNTLPGLSYSILRASGVNGSWTVIQTLSASGPVTFASPISVGSDTPIFFRAELALAYSPPLIIQPPRDLVVAQGGSATFTVQATGSPTPGYQWQFSGTNLPGATLSSLTIPNVQPANVGTYTVLVTNLLCSAGASASLGISWTNLLDDRISSSAAVGPDGTVYIATAQHVYALDSVRGTNKWWAPVINYNDNELAPSPAVAPDNSRVFIVGQDTAVMAFNPTNHSLLWSNHLGYGIDGSIYSSPAISPADGTLYVVKGDDFTNGLFAINPVTGVVNWIFQDNDPRGPGRLSDASPAIGSDCTVYFVAGSGDLYAVHPDGSLAWFFPFPAGSAPQSSPAIDHDGNLLIGSSDGYLYCIAPNGGLKWIYNTGDVNGVASSPAVGTDGTVYVASFYGSLYAVTNGALAWQFTVTIPFGTAMFVSSPAVTTNNVVFIGVSDITHQTNGLFAITNGMLKAVYPADSIWGSPAVNPADGGVIIGDLAGYVYKFPGDGKLDVNAPWPAFRFNARHSGAVANFLCSGGGPSVFPSNPHMSFQGTGFGFVLSGTPGSAWGIFASSDLANWAPFGSVVVNELGYTYYGDPTITDVAYRFYRAIANGGQSCSRIIGFVNQTILPGTNLIGNHLFQVNDGDYPQNTAHGTTALTIDDSLPLPPDGTQIMKWNGQGFETSSWSELEGRWKPSGDVTLLPGRAAFWINPSSEPATVPFMGLVAPGAGANLVAAGANFLSSILPKAGRVQTDLGFVPHDGDKVLLWRTNHYTTNTYSGGWVGGEPSLAVGEGFLLLSTRANAWTAGVPDCDQHIIVVPSNPLWTDSGFLVNAGDAVSMTAQGQWSPLGCANLHGPEGDGNTNLDTFLANVSRASLIAFVGANPFCDDLGTNRWGDTNYFPRPAGSNYWFIGTSGQFSASRSGKLWFGFNDDATSKLVNDNCGVVSGPVLIYHAP